MCRSAKRRSRRRSPIAASNIKARRTATPPEEPEPPDAGAEAAELLTGALGPEMGTAGDLAAGRLDCVLANEAAADGGSGAIRKVVVKASFEPEYARFGAAGTRAALLLLGENGDTVAVF